MHAKPVTVLLALVLLLPAGFARADDAPTPAQVLAEYNALIEKAPWGVGGADFRAAKDLCGKAKKAEKDANPVDFAHMQRVQAMTHATLGFEYLRINGSKMKTGWHLGLAIKNGADLKKAFDANKDLIAPVWEATKGDYNNINAKYVDAFKNAAGKIKMKIEEFKAKLNEGSEE